MVAWSPSSKRRSAVEPVIGYLKNEHRTGRNHLAQSAGDANNTVLGRWLQLQAPRLVAGAFVGLRPGLAHSRSKPIKPASARLKSLLHG